MVFISDLLKIKGLATTGFSSNKIYSAMHTPFSNSVQNIEPNTTNWCQKLHLIICFLISPSRQQVIV